jgi:hypothetical protein
MKIIITENQYRKLLSENNEDGIDEFKQFVKRGRFVHPDQFFDYYFSVFDYNDSDSLSAIENDDELYDIFLGKILSGYFINSYYKDKNNIISIFDYVVDRHSILLFKNRKDVINNFYKLLNLKLKLPYWYKNNLLYEFIDVSVNDVAKLMFNEYPPKEAIRQLSIITDKLGKRYKERLFHVIKKYAEENNLLLILKEKGFTFNRRENSMVRDVINYLKDPSEKIKTKTGFLRYIGSPLGGGQHATFWSALNKSGIIEKIGSGKITTYTIGSNYEEWEKGNLVTF